MEVRHLSMRKLSLYDLRFIYQKYVKMPTATFLFNIGAIQHIELLDSNEKKEEALRQCIKIFATMDAVVSSAPLPDKRYFKDTTYTSEDRKKDLKELNAIKAVKTIDITFAFMEFFTSPLMIYFHSCCQGKPLPYTTTRFINDLSRLQRYLTTDVSSTVKSDISSLIVTLDTKREQLDSLQQLKDSVEDISNEQSKLTKEQIEDRLDDISSEINKTELAIKEIVEQSHKKLRAELDAMVELRLKQLNRLQKEIEDTSITLRKYNRDIIDTVSSLNAKVDISPLEQMEQELRNTLVILRNTNSNDVRNSIETIKQLTGEIVKELKTKQQSSNTVKLAQDIQSITSNLLQLNVIAKECSKSVEGVEDSLPAIISSISSLMAELQSYRMSIVSTEAKIHNLRSKTIGGQLS